MEKLKDCLNVLFNFASYKEREKYSYTPKMFMYPKI